MIFLVAIAFLFLIEGLRKISRFVILIFQWKQSQEWLFTRGKIIQSNVQSLRVPAGGRKGYNVDGSVRLVWAYLPDIVYEYRANATEFQSSQIFLGQQFPSTLRFSNELVEKYPAGKEITVYYNPEKPEVATLERDRLKDLFPDLLGGLIYLLCGFMFLGQVLHE